MYPVTSQYPQQCLKLFPVPDYRSISFFTVSCLAICLQQKKNSCTKVIKTLYMRRPSFGVYALTPNQLRYKHSGLETGKKEVQDFNAGPNNGTCYQLQDSRQGFLLFSLLGWNCYSHLSEQQGPGCMPLVKPTSRAFSPQKIYVIWYLECYRYQFCILCCLFQKLQAYPYTIQLEPHGRSGLEVYLQSARLHSVA